MQTVLRQHVHGTDPCGCLYLAERLEHIVSRWAGRYDAAFTMETYVHASDDDLKQGRQALPKIHPIA
jgi:hypothetical protein